MTLLTPTGTISRAVMGDDEPEVSLDEGERLVVRMLLGLLMVEGEQCARASAG
jgi:hypothetical protein